MPQTDIKVKLLAHKAMVLDSGPITMWEVIKTVSVTILVLDFHHGRPHSSTTRLEYATSFLPFSTHRKLDRVIPPRTLDSVRSGLRGGLGGAKIFVVVAM